MAASPLASLTTLGKTLLLGGVVVFSIALAAMLRYCDSREEPGKNVHGEIAAASAAPENAPLAGRPQDSPQKDSQEATGGVNPAGEEQRQRADNILAFHNRAKDALTRGYYGVAEAINDNAQIYRKTWRLPVRGRIGAKNDARSQLQPPRGIFSEAEMKALAQALDNMDKALDAALARYAELENYVADPSIRDNGKRGVALAKEIGARHGQFMKARQTWLGIVEKRAAEAEALLLAEHPLQRQILNAQRMLEQIKEIAFILKSGSPDKGALESLCQNFAGLMEKAEMPPFPAAPDLERLYRAFLKNMSEYIAALRRGLNEGFFNPQKKELNMASVLCFISYNEFAHAASLRPVSR